MPIINRIADFHAEMTEWRQRIHAHPETAFEEHGTSKLVAELLESFGISVERGVARTGVIGTLQGSVSSSRAVALRADMDALHIEEQNDFPHVSHNPGRMHACGHDGIRQCFWGPPSTLQKPEILPGRFISSFSLPRKMRAGRA